LFARVAPAVSLRTGEVKTIPLAKIVLLHLIQPDFAATFQDKNKLLALMVIGAAACRSRRQAKYMRLRYRTPARSLIMQCLWTCILCVSGSYGQLLDYIIFAVLMFYILTIGGLIVLRFKRPDQPRPYRAFGYPALPAIYILMAIFIDGVLLRYKPQYTWPGLIIVLLGIPVYFLWSKAGPVPVFSKDEAAN
jgi:hypothetical protein